MSDQGRAPNNPLSPRESVTANPLSPRERDGVRDIRIAFLTPTDVSDRRAWSGTNYGMASALARAGAEVRSVRITSPAIDRLMLTARVVNRLSRQVTGRKFNFEHTRAMARRQATVIHAQLEELQPDVVFSPANASAVACLDTRTPIIYASDTTFALLCDYHQSYTALSKGARAESNRVEGLAINNAAAAIYSSEWAARSAIEDYGADPTRVHVVAFGANIDDEDVPARDCVLARKRSSKCRLLFLAAKYWQRKGGDIAFETLIELHKLGVEAELIVCGCVPPAEFAHEAMTVIPFLDKRDPEQRRRISELLLTSDFLILPTRNDCTPIACSEASAFGLPSVVAATGGVPGVVKEGANGLLLPYEARGSEYAARIREVYEDENRYLGLVRSTRDEYEAHLNWSAWAARVSAIITELLQESRPAVRGAFAG